MDRLQKIAAAAKYAEAQLGRALEAEAYRELVAAVGELVGERELERLQKEMYVNKLVNAYRIDFLLQAAIKHVGPLRRLEAILNKQHREAVLEAAAAEIAAIENRPDCFFVRDNGRIGKRH